jgi:hypothetical protein
MTRWPCRAPAEAEWLEDDAAQARHPGPGRRTETLILGGHDFHSITEVVSSVLERKAPLGWWAVLGVALLMLGGLAVGVPWLVWEGIGVWGLNVPVGWAWDITNFVFWVGIGHAGTLISAILLLFRQSGAPRSTARPRR